MATDIPNVAKEVEAMTEDMREGLKDMASTNLMFFAKGIMGFKDMTEDCHGPLCAFFELNKKQYKIGLMPRDCFKSSVITMSGGAQTVLRDPEQRLLLRNESSTNAERFLRGIRQQFEKNKVLRGIYSDVIPKDIRKVRWNDQELELKRNSTNPEPTIDTSGMTSAYTSRHYTHIIDDDPISEEAVKSEKVMHDAITRLTTIPDLLQDPSKDQHWYIGTRWAFHDTASWYMKTFSAYGVGIFARSIIEDGKPIFPERINAETIELKRTILGPYRFSCLQMNNPRNEEVQDLNVEDLQVGRLVEDTVYLYNTAGEVIDKWRLDQLDITVTVDPAPAEKVNSDRNAVVTCGISPRNQAIVLDVFAERCTPYRVIEHLLWLHIRFHPRVYGIEGVAYQKVFKYVLAREAERIGIFLRIQELKAPGKHKQHVKGLQPLMTLKRLFICGAQAILRQELADYPLGEHDDTADALGLQPQLWKGRLSPEHLEKVEREARKLGQAIRGYGLKHDPGLSYEAATKIGLIADDRDPADYVECDWEEMVIESR